MQHCNAKISAAGTIYWQCDMGDPGDGITFLIHLSSLNDIWKLFQADGQTWLRPLGDPSGQWIFDPDEYGRISGRIIGKSWSHQPAVTIGRSAGGVVFTVS